MKAYTPIARTFFGNARILTDTRAFTADSLCFSRLLIGTDTWTRRCTHAEGIMNQARMRVLRRICDCPRYKAGGPTDLQVLERLQLEPTDVVLLKKRLLALPAQLSNHAPAALKVFRRQQGTDGARLLLEDLRAAWQNSKALRNMPDPGVVWKPWLDFIQGDKHGWHSAVQCIQRAPEASRPGKPVFLDESDPLRTDCPGQFVCSLCPPHARRVCASAAALASHSRLAHKARTLEYQAIVDIDDEYACPVCAQQFPTVKLAANHLRDTNCRMQYGMRSTPRVRHVSIRNRGASATSITQVFGGRGTARP